MLLKPISRIIFPAPVDLKVHVWFAPELFPVLKTFCLQAELPRKDFAKEFTTLAVSEAHFPIVRKIGGEVFG